MKKTALALFTCISVLLSGCATKQITEADVKPIAAERQLAYQTPIENEAIIKVTRINNYGGNACYFTFLIDGERVCRIDTNERAYFHVPAGKHVVQVTGDQDGQGLCGVGIDEEYARAHGQIRTVTVEAGREYDYKIGFNWAVFAATFRLYVDEVGKPIEKTETK